MEFSRSNQIKTAFFTEAGSGRGMGHLVRTHTILEYFKEKGIDTVLFLESDTNYDYKYNDILYFHWDTFELKEYYDYIFIDSYEADILIYKTIQEHCKTAIYIDDYTRLSYPKGMILNFAPDAHLLFTQEEDIQHNFLLGLQYIPIRDALQNIKVQKKEQIFIMLGGSDTKNLTYKIVDILSELPIKKVVVISNEATAKKLKHFKNTQVLYNPNDTLLAQMMANSSLAISTASMGVYELSYLKTAVLMIAVSYNQVKGIEQLLKYKVAQDFVDINADGYEKELYLKIEALLKNNPLTSSIIDGLGTKKIYEKVIAI